MSRVNYFNQDISFKVSHPRKTGNWIKSAIKKEGFTLNELNYIFCSDEGLLQINLQYLSHNTYTDIITFDNSEVKGTIEGDIFISIERVRENAHKLEVPFQDELHRVMIHGALHLMGYSDKGKANQLNMRKKEDAYLSLREV